MALPHTPFILPAALGEKGLGAGTPTWGFRDPCFWGAHNMHRHCYTDMRLLRCINEPQNVQVHLEERVVQMVTFRMGHEE